MAKQPYSLRSQNNPRTQLLNEISRLKIAIKMKTMQQEDETVITSLHTLLAAKEQELENLTKLDK